MNNPSNDPSPGTGWWLASDGQWYPQKWDSKFVWFVHRDVEELCNRVGPLLRQYGQEGWEVVSSSITQTRHGSTYEKAYGDYPYTIICTLKRPLAP